jgi:predicted MFS family arabinose efflux permease
MIIPTIPVLARQFEVSAGAAAQIITAFAIGKFVGTVIGGIVLDRMGARIALLGGLAVASVAALWASWLPWFTAILALALVMGAADSLWAIAREIAGIDLARCSQQWSSAAVWPSCSAATWRTLSISACRSRFTLR